MFHNNIVFKSYSLLTHWLLVNSSPTSGTTFTLSMAAMLGNVPFMNVNAHYCDDLVSLNTLKNSGVHVILSVS